MSEYKHQIDPALWDARQKECRPIFKMKSVLMTHKSKEAGREIWEDHEHLEIIIPGDNKSRVSRPVRDEDRERWPDQYRAFKEGLDDDSDGQLLKMLPGISDSQIKMLEFQNVRTIEELANLGDGQVQNIGMGGLELRNKARAMVLATTESEKFAQFEGLQAQNEALQGQLQALMVKVEAMENPPPKKRGRPPKVVTEAGTAEREAAS